MVVFNKVLPLIFCFTSTLALAQNNKLPPDAKAVLDQLPGQEITMDVVLALGLERSSELKAIIAQAPRSEAAILAAQAPLDTRVTSSISRLVDQSDQINTFAPDETLGTTFTLGVSKYFSTGTTLATSYTTGRINISFPEIPGFPEIPEQSHHQVSIELRQKLWQDAFGRATRASLREAEASKNSVLLGVEAQVEAWARELIGFYYQVWLAKSELDAAIESQNRAQRIAGITNLKLRRGTAERPDSLQMQAQLQSATLRVENAKETLRGIWRQLVIKLGLPSQWINIDPSLIPVRLDDPIDKAIAVCGPYDKLNPTPESIALIRQRNLEAEAAKERAMQAGDQLRPNLEAFLSASSNAFNEESRLALDDTLGYENPSWQVGVNLILPLGNSGAKAGLANALANQQSAEANKSAAIELVETQWLNECKGLHQLISNIKVQTEVFNSQRERERLEENRFQIGRTQAFNVVQAGLDAIQAEISLRQSQVRARNSAWTVLQLADQLEPYLNELKNLKVTLN